MFSKFPVGFLLWFSIWGNFLVGRSLVEGFLFKDQHHSRCRNEHPLFAKPKQSAYIYRGPSAKSKVLHSRVTIPLIILDSMVPGQKLHFSSSDPKFDQLIKYLHESNTNEIGIIGWDEGTSYPLRFGVTAPIKQKDIVFGINKESERVLSATFKGTRRFQILGEPWMDSSESFFIAHVEVLDDRTEATIPPEYQDQLDQLHHMIPVLLDRWMETVISSGKISPAGITEILKQIGPMPSTQRDRAIWVAALLNPTTSVVGLSQEIRPTMLSCQTDFDRMVLACVALKSSIKAARTDKRR